jgi:chaperonin cofactor prefoldin
MSADSKSLELYDLKQEIVQNSYKHKIIEKNVNTITVNLKKNDIIEKEIDRLDDATKVYDRIGRM